MSPGQASSTVVRSRPKTVSAYFVEKVRPDWAWVTCMPRSKRPETTRMKASLSRWWVSIPAWTLKTTPENASSTSRIFSTADPPEDAAASTAFGSDSRAPGSGARAHSVSRIWWTPKFSIAEAKIRGEVVQSRKSSWSCTAPSAASSSASSAAVSQAPSSLSDASAGE